MTVSLTEQLKLDTSEKESALFLEVCTRYAQAATAVSEFYFENEFRYTMKDLHQKL